MAGYAQTDLAVDLEAAGRGQKAERRRAQGVLAGEHDAAMVDAVGVGGGGGRADDGEVPVEDVGVGDGVGVEVRRRRGRGGRELVRLFHEPADGGVGGQRCGGHGAPSVTTTV